MTDQRLRVAVVGMGIGQLHVASFKAVRDRFEIAVICDADEARATSVVERLRGCSAETDFAAVCARDDIDVIDLCTPPFLHFEQAMQALESGKHVICEKPLVGSLAEVDQLAEAERRNGRRVMPVFQYRFGHGLQKLRALVQAGVTGAAHVTTVDLAWRRRPEYYAVPWRGRRETELGGVVLSHAVHVLDMVTYILGQPRSVFARTAVRVNDVETEDCASISMEMGDGSLATISATLGSVEEITRHRFCFEGLVAESNTEPYANSSDPWTFTPDTPEGGELIERVLEAFEPQPEGYVAQFAGFHRALLEGGEPPVTLADARAALEVVTAVYASAAERRDVDLPLAPDDPWVGGWNR